MEAHFGTPIKQYPGQQQVDRAVVVSVPGKHFTFLSAAQQKLSYDGAPAAGRRDCRRDCRRDARLHRHALQRYTKCNTLCNTHLLV